jgi:hypothetical protein
MLSSIVETIKLLLGIVQERLSIRVVSYEAFRGRNGFWDKRSYVSGLTGI